MTRLTAHQLAASRLRDALRAGGLDEFPDADLLDRFARYAEHEAFEALLRRHGPVVYGVCRRVLANAADADDAFQATFLVLVRRARSLRQGDRLGPWLYGVAVRVAMKARARRARLAERRTEATDMIPDPSSPAEALDWLPILDAELQALPAKYREPLVLCELQGASRAIAAKTLGIPEGTLSSRLARGRELLRRRLLKHGTLLPAGGLAALFSAGGVGRATVLVALLAKTSESASIITTGAALAGTVPAGAARLTDEVLKGMFITKLRAASGAVLAASLVIVGMAAAWPGEVPGQPAKPKASSAAAKAADAKAQPAKPATNGPKSPDHEALQGLWVLDKYELPKGVGAEGERQAKGMAGKMKFLIAGDVWWGMQPGESNGVKPMRVKIDPTKNPKWIDIQEPGGAGESRCIYELDGEKLRICVAEGKGGRPAEFSAEDDTPLVVMQFRHERLPPAVGDKALIGSWVGELVGQGDDGRVVRLPTQRVVVVDHYLFVFSSEKGRGNDWIGGRYTVDTTKNPKWIDVELVAPLPDSKVTKFYGCYEVVDGQLKLALGTKRVTRPLELADVPDVLFLDVQSTKEPFVPVEKAPRQSEPPSTPKARDIPKSATTPPIVTSPDSSPAPIVTSPDLSPAPNPASAPKPKAAPGPVPAAKTPAIEDDWLDALTKAGQFSEAEKVLHNRLPARKGLEAAETRLLLATCLLERARGCGPAEAEKVRKETTALLQDASRAAETDPKGGDRGKRIRIRADLSTLRVLQQLGSPDEVLEAVDSLLAKYRETVEELIVLSYAYWAFQHQESATDARRVKQWMGEAFDKLKKKTGAFPAETGEYSRAYWEDQWFAGR